MCTLLQKMAECSDAKLSSSDDSNASPEGCTPPLTHKESGKEHAMAATAEGNLGQAYRAVKIIVLRVICGWIASHR